MVFFLEKLFATTATKTTYTRINKHTTHHYIHDSKLNTDI